MIYGRTSKYTWLKLFDNNQFQLARDKSRPGKGAHWTIDQTVGEMFEQGNYRQGRGSNGNHNFAMMIYPRGCLALPILHFLTLFKNGGKGQTNVKKLRNL